MPKVIFKDSQQNSTEVEASANAKILALGLRAKLPIRYGCAACSCGTCAVRIQDHSTLNAMEEDEKALLSRIGLDTSGEIRLSCRARVQDADIEVDLGFQDEYSPD